MTADSSLESRLSLKVKRQASVLCQDQNGLSVTDMAILEASAETMRGIRIAEEIEKSSNAIYFFTNFLWHLMIRRFETTRMTALVLQGSPQMVQMLLEREQQEDEDMENEASSSSN